MTPLTLGSLLTLIPVTAISAIRFSPPAPGTLVRTNELPTGVPGFAPERSRSDRGQGYEAPPRAAPLQSDSKRRCWDTAFGHHRARIASKVTQQCQLAP